MTTEQKIIRAKVGVLELAKLRGNVSKACQTRHLQTNGICERFHETMLNEFYRVTFRKKIYRTLEKLQTDLDGWMEEYNQQRPYQGRWCYGKTPIQTCR